MVSTIPAISDTLNLITLTPQNIIKLIGIGFLGGTMSGLLGSGGAFIMTPAMMSLGVPGIMAVAANITHKFGKAIQGARKHNELGNVDKKLGLIMFLALFAGVRMAYYANSGIMEQLGEAYSNLYINSLFVLVLSFVTILITYDIAKREKTVSQPNQARKPSLLLNIPPVIYFPVAKVRVSLWIVLLVGLITGYLAGTVGVGGFVGVPAMIYLLGISPYVAAGTELFLAIFSGAYGAYLYTLNGYLDIRIVLLLYLGSLIGINIGAIATKIVTDLQIRLIMAITVGMVALSRAFSIPVNLVDTGHLSIKVQLMEILNLISNIVLFGSVITMVLILTCLIINKLIKKSSPVKNRS